MRWRVERPTLKRRFYFLPIKIKIHPRFQWRGIPCVRSKPGPPKKKPSPTQLAQQASFRLISKFLHPLGDLLSIGFSEQSKKMTAANAAMQHNLKAAITGNYPDLAIKF